MNSELEHVNRCHALLDSAPVELILAYESVRASSWMSWISFRPLQTVCGWILARRVRRMLRLIKTCKHRREFVAGLRQKQTP